ncbi:hypothetical protein PCG10_003604 [Penicillium crustosum]|uniref:Extracellular mutant protein 11 C-terminal domain-containing protein n=1 Tax=Penicillium crustosum TaxID=36656 RepID=A0A9P5GUZ3_PENCR|nr:hypothetical protein PCG10_003604 [Penicillium crustosum]
MGVGDYVHSKEGGQARGAPDQATQSRQQRAEQARVEVPVTQLVDSGLPGTNGIGGSLGFHGTSQFPNQPRGLPTHGAQRDRDVFDTDVEAIDDSTVAGTSVYGFDDSKSQAASSTNAAYTKPDPQSAYQPRPSRQTYGSNWYEGLGDQAMKKAGFDSDDFDDFGSQMSSSIGGDGGDNEKPDEAHWHASHKPRTTEEPLSKRLENFWSASRKRTSSRQPVTVDSDPEPQTKPQPKSKPRKLGQMLPPTGPRKIVLPHSSSATPRTRFSPPKPSLLEQLDQQLDASPTRHNSQLPPDVGRTLSIASFQDSEGGTDDGMDDHTIRADVRIESGGHSINAFDMTSLTDLDVDHTLQDPFFVHESHEINESHEPLRRGRSNTVIHSKKRPLEADYPPEVLYQKSFSELQAEPFDKSPTPPPPVIKSPSLPPNPPSVPDTQEPKNAVSHLLALTHQERQTYLSHMTMDEWEDCGDQMIGRFTDLLSEMKNLRRARRRTAAVFEGEVKRRHDQVETQSLELTNKLTEMRTGGAEVLRGRHS